MTLKAGTKRYLKNGFTPEGVIKGSGLLKRPVAASTTINKGYAVFDNGSGYAATGTAFSTLFLGIAAATADNSAGSAGDIDVYIIPATADIQYWVPVEDNAEIAITDVGTVCDLQAAYSIDKSDTTIVQWGFIIEDYDASTEAVAIETYGFAKGRIIASER